MSEGFFDKIYNPDVLSCLANLSNDEVFTPPDIANQMLDMLPQELFQNPDTTFLDPACKSGVFLREIAKRLIVGLEPQFPDLQERVDHIFHKQLGLYQNHLMPQNPPFISDENVSRTKAPAHIITVPTAYDDTVFFRCETELFQSCYKLFEKEGSDKT